MPLYVTSHFVGDIIQAKFNIPLHWRISEDNGNPQSDVVQIITYGLQSAWSATIKPYLSNRCVLTKVTVEGYDDPTFFHERPCIEVGGQSGDDMPSYVAMGFRQLRSNQLYRASKHAFPGGLETNNDDGSWISAGGVDSAGMAAIAVWLSTPHDLVMPDVGTVTVVPVLIRTQYTTPNPPSRHGTVTLLDPHEISDVAGGEFYGWTSQVSRKRISKRA